MVSESREKVGRCFPTPWPVREQVYSAASKAYVEDWGGSLCVQPHYARLHFLYEAFSSGGADGRLVRI
jgi:hypothetical protein